MKKGFIISWYYPPGNSSEGLVTFKLLKNSKLQYDVWTRASQAQNMWDRKINEDRLVAKNVNIIKGSNNTLSEWMDGAVKYFADHRDEYDFIMSRCMPVESHEIAIKIKQKFPDIKWIASYGDPIVNTPYIDAITMGDKSDPFVMKEYFAKEEMSPLKTAKIFISPTRFAKKYAWKKEKRAGNNIAKRFAKINQEVMHKADRVIFNNQFQLDHEFLDKEIAEYRDKGVVIEHPFDSDLYSKGLKPNNKKLTFTYVGHLDDMRNADSLLSAIAHLKKQDESLYKKVEFNFYGHISDKNKIFIIDNNLCDVVKIHNDVDYLESLRIMQETDWAILIDANFTAISDEYIFLPAKLADYIGAEANILVISHLKGAAADVVAETGGGKVVTHCENDIYMYLANIIYNNYKPAPYDKKKVLKYSAAEQSKKMDNIIKEIVK